MDETAFWIDVDGDEPEPVRAVLDRLRDLPPATPEDQARLARAFFAKLDARLLVAGIAAPAEPAQDDASPPPAPLLSPADAPAPRVRPLRLEPPDPEDAEPMPIAETPPPAPAPPIVPAPPRTGAPSALAATSLTLDLPRLEARGSMPVKPPEDLSPAQPCSRTEQLPQSPRPGLDATKPSEGDSFIRAMALVPFLWSPTGGPLILGGLTFDQYVSLRAELAVAPGAEAALLAKYHLNTPAGRAEVDQQWQRHIARSPAMRAFYEEKLARFIEHARPLHEQAERRQG